jgi:hypothetical protein
MHTHEVKRAACERCQYVMYQAHTMNKHVNKNQKYPFLLTKLKEPSLFVIHTSAVPTPRLAVFEEDPCADCTTSDTVFDNGFNSQSSSLSRSTLNKSGQTGQLTNRNTVAAPRNRSSRKDASVMILLTRASVKNSIVRWQYRGLLFVLPQT